jgi:hypothetical protein
MSGHIADAARDGAAAAMRGLQPLISCFACGITRRHINDPAAFSMAFDAETERQVAPFYRNQIAADRVRVAEMNALFDGAPPPASNPALSTLLAAAYRDADVFHAMLETVLCVAAPRSHGSALRGVKDG